MAYFDGELQGLPKAISAPPPPLKLKDGDRLPKMPALVLFRRRYRIASDDLHLPALWLALSLIHI